ncbi:MAG: L,D-transpeptidase, partial [Methylocystis sp.]|nr:L,D-transpeptidase [Methylocystis sp.]
MCIRDRPYSIFFRGGYAIHGTYATAQLGTPASHGCVRLSPAHAKMLYEMVQREGASISINGLPRGPRYASR